jgi:signal peptidase I
VEEPTVPTGLARSVEPVAQESDDGPAGFPGRHRRRAGESPDERPAAAYREQAGRKSRGGKRRRSTFWKELPVLVVVALLLTFLIQTFIAKVYVIPSGSMETTLHGCSGCVNDRVIVDKITYRFGNPEPGDVVVFRGPDSWRNSEFTVEETANPVLRGLQGLGSLVGLAPPDEKDFVKRVIAVGGQTVACCDPRNRVLVDGTPLDEPYIYYLPDAGSARQAPFGPVTVPDGQLWMMGDSRNNSADSRVPGHGPVPVANVIGQVRFIVMPFSRFRSIPSIDPRTTAIGMAGSPADGGAAALSVLGVLPVLVRRRVGYDDEFLPPSRRRRRRVLAARTHGPGGGARFRHPF